jgi:hypothetical protein
MLFDHLRDCDVYFTWVSPLGIFRYHPKFRLNFVRESALLRNHHTQCYDETSQLQPCAPQRRTV